MKKIILLLFVIATVQLHAQSSKELDSIMQVFYKSNAFSGSVLVSKNGKVLLTGGYGMADAANKKSNTANTVFQIGSVTKQFTAAAIMQLQEQKKLSVNDPVSRYFPDLRGGDSITLHQLLTHRSGLYNYTDDTAKWYGKLTRVELISYLNKKLPLFRPGTRMQYCNSGYALLGYLIAQLSGMPYEQYIRQHIFKPLKMKSSGFDFANLQWGDKAVGYYDNGTAFLKARSIDSTISFAAGAIYSTTADMLQWSKALLQQKLLKPASWKMMATNYGNKFGYGLIIDTVHGQQNTWHNGGLDGFVTTFYNLPKQKVTVVVFSNYMQTNTIRVANALTAAALGQPYELPKQRSEASLPADSLKQYIGVYQLSPAFAITVSVLEGKLMAQATNQQSFQIYPEKRDYFFYKVVDAQIEFGRDSSGAVVELTLNQNGMKLKGKKAK